MFVPSILDVVEMNDCTTPLFFILAPTCFGNSLLSPGSFLDPSELLEIQTEWVVYNIKCGYVACVPNCRGSDGVPCQLMLPGGCIMGLGPTSKSD
jgi:hypothetical protein